MSSVTQPQPEPGCTWVKPGWALKSTDFHLNSIGARITADTLNLSWTINATEFTWQSPKNHEPDLWHLMSCIRKAAHKLPESLRQQFIWNMREATRKAARELVTIREQVDATVKNIEENGSQS